MVQIKIDMLTITKKTPKYVQINEEDSTNINETLKIIRLINVSNWIRRCNELGRIL